MRLCILVASGMRRIALEVRQLQRHQSRLGNSYDVVAGADRITTPLGQSILVPRDGCIRSKMTYEDIY